MTILGKRPIWKGPFFKAFNLPKLNTDPDAKAAVFQLRTTQRNCTILPQFLNHTFHVHNGKQYIPVKVTEEMIGHRLGEFAHTKKFYKRAPQTSQAKKK